MRTSPPRAEGGLAGRIAKSNAEVDARVRRYVERVHAQHAERNAIKVRQAAELSPAERRRFGFADDWHPRQPTRTGRRRP